MTTPCLVAAASPPADQAPSAPVQAAVVQAPSRSPAPPLSLPADPRIAGGWYTSVAAPLLFALDPETAHALVLRLLRWAPLPTPAPAPPALRVQVLGQAFTTPVGVAAGLDKNGEAIAALAGLGFSHVEIGTITGLAQPGNPRPRLFRLVRDGAIINRMGFNNQGADRVAARLAAQFGSRRPACRLGINIGKSKVVDLGAALADHERSVRALAGAADYLVVNVSSPNTPGLRDLQSEAHLRPLLAGVQAAIAAVRPGLPLLVKVAPDLDDAGLDAVVDVALELGVAGIIATNTTVMRAPLQTGPARVARCGAGGLSGRPLASRATAVLARIARRIRRQAGTRGMQPALIGVGGIDGADAAWERIGAGADLIQVYSALIYHGPGLVGRIERGLLERLQRHGLREIGQATGRNL